MSKDSLNRTVKELTTDVGTRVLGKREFRGDDSIILDNGIELPCDILIDFVKENSSTSRLL